VTLRRLFGGLLLAVALIMGVGAFV
jgi:hypothetical protein